MPLVEIDRHPSRQQLALFTLLWIAVFGLPAALAKSHSPASAVLGAVALGVPAAGWVVPGLMRWIYLLACYATFPVGWVLSYVVLAAAFYLVLTPTGWIMRLAGYDPMQRRFDRQAQSYWTSRRDPDRRARYFRQF
jgi:hypothetical protein